MVGNIKKLYCMVKSWDFSEGIFCILNNDIKFEGCHLE